SRWAIRRTINSGLVSRPLTRDIVRLRISRDMLSLAPPTGQACWIDKSRGLLRFGFVFFLGFAEPVITIQKLLMVAFDHPQEVFVFPHKYTRIGEIFRSATHLRRVH